MTLHPKKSKDFALSTETLNFFDLSLSYDILALNRLSRSGDFDNCEMLKLSSEISDFTSSDRSEKLLLRLCGCPFI